MAAVLQFRRGTFQNDLVASEPFFDDSSELLYVGVGVGTTIVLSKLNDTNNGSFSITGDISASNASFSGTVTVTNDIVIGGSIVLGDNPVDEISFNGVLSGSMIPTTGSVFNIGSPTNPWNVMYADKAIIPNLTASYVEYTNVFNKPTLVSGSSQISVSGTSDFDADRWIDHSNVQISAGNGLIGGGSINTTQTLTLNTGSTHFIDAVTNIAGEGTVPIGTVSGSSQLTSSYDARYTLSGSISPLPSGVVSGSSQISYPLISNIPFNIVSGSSQLTSSYDTRYTISGSVQPLPSGVVSGSSQISFTDITDKPSLVSGSSQVTSSLDTRYELLGGAGAIYNNSYYGGVIGTKNGTNTTFSVSESSYRESSLVVYLNGQAFFSGSGILETDPTNGIFDFEIGGAPVVTDTIYTTYEVGTFSTASFFNINDTTTSVGGHILPNVTVAYDLGSPTFRWRDLYLSGSTIFLGEGKVSFNTSGSLEVRNSTDDIVDLVVRDVIFHDTQSGKRSKLRYNGSDIVSDEFDSSGTFIGKTSSNLSGSFTGSFTGDGSGLTGVGGTPSVGTISGSSQLTSSFDSRYILSGSIVNGSLPSGVISGSSQLTSSYYRSYVDSTGNGLVGVQNGTNTSFTSSQAGYLIGSVMAYVAGYPLVSGNGLTETNPTTGVITFDTPPESFDIIIIQYTN